MIRIIAVFFVSLLFSPLLNAHADGTFDGLDYAETHLGTIFEQCQLIELGNSGQYETYILYNGDRQESFRDSSRYLLEAVVLTLNRDHQVDQILNISSLGRITTKDDVLYDFSQYPHLSYRGWEFSLQDLKIGEKEYTGLDFQPCLAETQQRDSELSLPPVLLFSPFDYPVLYRTQPYPGFYKHLRENPVIVWARSGLPPLQDLEFPDVVYNEIDQFSREQKRLIRNAMFALHGMMFTSVDLNHYFRTFDWYQPDPAVKSSLTTLNESQARLFNYLAQEL